MAVPTQLRGDITSITYGLSPFVLGVFSVLCSFSMFYFGSSTHGHPGWPQVNYCESIRFLVIGLLTSAQAMPFRPEPEVEVPVGEAAKGAKIFKKSCEQCHTMGKHRKSNNCGPPLHDIIGRPAGTYQGEGFLYSSAIQDSGIVWSSKHLFVYLNQPKKYTPGTKMPMRGLKIDKDRADLIAYIHNQM